jgi:UDP-N-acetylglucosamine acyltransferase
MAIHPTAVVSPAAELGSDVEIGPYATIGENVKLGAGSVVHQHVTITGHTTIGKGNMFYPGAIIGTLPQDLKYRGEVTYLEIGDNNTFREYVTVNVGTGLGGGVTRIGEGNLIMAYCHIAHDCIIDNNTIFANCAMLGGHVQVEEGAAFGGMVGVHHFVTVGKWSFVGGMSRIVQDIPPFMMVEGNPARVRGVNIVGLKRRGISEDRVEAVKYAWRKLYKDEGTMSLAIEEAEKSAYCTEDLKYLFEFLRRSEQGKYGRALEAQRKA